MTRRGAAFDLLVTHIEKRLQAQGSTVTWLDQTLDPGDPSEPRAIDITIQRDGRLTLVEIRDHKAADPAGWLAEFAARRRNLQADAAIAVTALTIDAALDAAATRHGLILRPLTELSDPEIDGWGRTVPVEIVSMQFQKLHLQASIREAESGLIQPQPTLASRTPGENAVAVLVAFLRQAFHDKIGDGWSRWKVDLEHDGVTVDGAAVQAMTVVFEARLERQRIALASCVMVPPGKHPYDGQLLIVDLSQQVQGPNRLLHDVIPDAGLTGGPRSVKIVGGDAMAQSQFDVITMDVIAVAGQLDVARTGA